MINKKNIPLYIALAIPVLMIVLIAAIIYLPTIGVRPKYNFIYMSGSNTYYYGVPEYVVSGGHLIKNSPPPTPINMPSIPLEQKSNPDVHFYLYNLQNNSATEISFDQAAGYNLNSSNTSPDGYTIQQGNYGGGDFIFGSPGYDYNQWFIKGHNRSTKLNLSLNGNYYNFQFLGWIE